MRFLAVLLTSLGLLLAFAATASAEWSKPQLPSVPSGAVLTNVAVNGRDDAAFAWVTSTTVNLTVRQANGRLRTRRVSSERKVGAAAVAIDRRGELTVAWSSYPTAKSAGVARAAHGPIVGHWAVSRDLGPLSGNTDKMRLAVAPDGRVLLVWIGATRKSPNDGAQFVAWRAPGHNFGSSTALSRPRTHELAVPVFDAAGTAYLSAACDRVVRIAAPHSSRFGRPIFVAPGAVSGFSVSVSDRGTGLVSWGTGECPSDAGGGSFGPVYVRTLKSGTFAPARMLGGAGEFITFTAAVAAPGGGGTVSWPRMLLSPAPYASSTVRLSPDGVPGPVVDLPNALAPVAADGGGDLVFAHPFDVGTVPYSAVIRPASGGPDQPSPLAPPLLGFYTPGFAVASPGRAVAAARTNTTNGRHQLQLSVWRP